MAKENYSRLWKKADSLRNLGQYKTALELVNSILVRSKADGSQDQTVKALLYRIKLGSYSEEDNEVKAIAFLKEEYLASHPPVTQILSSVLAEIYWQYYRDHRWQINGRTIMQSDTSQDITTWDAGRFSDASSGYYLFSVKDAPLLKKIPTDQFGSILEGEKSTRRFRPTLYDFLAFRAIDFFTSESSFPQSTMFDKVSADKGLFSPAASFVLAAFPAGEGSSFEFRALKLFQDVISFHLTEAPDADALIDADLARLEFAYRISTLPDKPELYLAALRQLAGQYKDQPVSASVLYRLALQLKNEGSRFTPGKTEDHKWEIKEALELAEKTARQFPGTDGGKNCRSLAAEIKLPQLVITGNNAVLPGLPSLALAEFRNVEKLYVRVVRVNADTVFRGNYTDNRELLKKYRKLKPVQQWMVPLPSDGDYQSHSAEIKVPEFPAGQYILLASVNPEFATDSPVNWFHFQCTGISLLSRPGSGESEFMVFDRKEGNPLSGVKVRKYYTEYDYTKRRNISVPGESGITGNDGNLRFKPSGNEKNRSFYLILENGKDRFVSENFYQWIREVAKPEKEIKTWFFTDRAIYRPGQVIYFKGIVTEKSGDRIVIRTGYRSEAGFYDVNSQEIAKIEVVTNEFGSFTGSFTAPSGRLTGNYSIHDDHGGILVQVEEYKRPKFETVFNPVEGSFKLGEQITVTGKAVNYAGNPVSEGTVTFRVKRNARFPWIWWGFENDHSNASEEEILQGKTITDARGEFSIQFKAIPDPAVPKENMPVFDFSVDADVTDINGETHSAGKVISVGYQALQVNTGLTDEVDLSGGLEFSLHTANLNGQPEKASGEITIHRIRQPRTFLYSRKWKRPDLFTMTPGEFKKSFPEEVYNNEGDISTWEKGEKILERPFSTPSDSLIRVHATPEPGLYLLEIRTKDIFGEEVIYKKYFNAFDPGSDRNSAHTAMMVTLLKDTAEPGETVPLILSSPISNVYVLLELITRGEITRRNIYLPDNRQIRVDIPVSAEQRGNTGVHVTFIKNNRSFQEQRMIRVPRTDKELSISTGSFRDKLQPGEEEEWNFTIRDRQGNQVVAEFMASMYDASLDAFLIRPWSFPLYPEYPVSISWEDDQGFGTGTGTTLWYPTFPGPVVPKIYEQLMDFGFYGNSRGRQFRIRGNMIAPQMEMNAAAPAPPAEETEFKMVEEEKTGLSETLKAGSPGQGGSPVLPPSKPRTDLRETAFFLPQLMTNAAGETILRFKMPESLTRWNFRGLAHTRDLKTGMIEKSLVTQKDLMVFPNPPRFLREGDHMRFTAKISNISGSPLTGNAELHFFDAFTMQPADVKMNLQDPVKVFNTGIGESAVTGWDIIVPEGLEAVVYRVTATAGGFSDGEEAALPVLTNRMLVTESLPLPVRANSAKSFLFTKLADSGHSSTIQNYRLTLEYTSNPVWYAIQALPYLMEFPHECSEQLFSRFYANTLAAYIANSDPAIRQVFDSWKMLAPGALKSNLEKNEELKSVLLQESPWVREASGENERKQKLGELFDMIRMAGEQQEALKKLAAMQTVNGGWPWFPGMQESEFITRHIVTGIGHLKHLKVVDIQNDENLSPLVEKAVGFLDAEKAKEFEELKKRDSQYLKTDHLDAQTIQYFYARSFFGDLFPFGEYMTEMVNYYISQAVKYWTGQSNYLKAMTALFLNRMDQRKTALLIMRSLGETALHSEESGMYWKQQPAGWFWYQAPVESQALITEAFDEVSGDRDAVDELKVWLLKQKQTRDWKTTKATTEAIYALLLRGTSLLSSGQQVNITVGGKRVNPYLSTVTRPEPGTGYFKTTWENGDITPDKGKIKVDNPNPHIAWGAMYWQYFEKLDKITPAGTPLKVRKSLLVEVNTPSGPQLREVTPEKPIKTGDKVVVRVVLSSDRDMEYIHLKDMRASAFEPLNVLSGYRWQGGLGYYESTRDAATNFFMDYLPKGTYVFEYRLFATQKGEFSNGITSVQCMYAPEYSSHSEGIRVKIE